MWQHVLYIVHKKMCKKWLLFFQNVLLKHPLQGKSNIVLLLILCFGIKISAQILLDLRSTKV